MITIEQINIKIADAIKRSGLTQVEIAKRLHIRQASISNYLRGKKSPSLETFANLCAILDVDTNDILCIDSFKED